MSKIEWTDATWKPVTGCTKISAGRFIILEPLLVPLTLDLSGIDWVIVGGESGPHARPMPADWVRDIRDQCEDAGVPFLFKQWGAWFPRDQWEYNPDLVLPDDDVYEHDHKTMILSDHTVMHRVGKRRAGRLLDGVIYDEYPSAMARPE